jgi:YidC/Oxa1 family membrane protein insertase
MNQARTFLLIAWLMVGYLLWDTWQQDYHRTPTDVPERAQNQAPAAVQESPEDLPSFEPSAAAKAAGTLPAGQPARGRRIELRNDVLSLGLDTRGASVVSADLLVYRRTPDADAPPVRLLSNEPSELFVAQSGYIGSRADLPTHATEFSADADRYALADDADRVHAELVWEANDGLRLIRRFELERGAYVLKVSDRWENGSEALSFKAYRQLVRKPPPPLGYSFTNPAAYSFIGAAWYSPQTKFDKQGFDDFADEPLKLQASQGWIAMIEHYFFAAWIPDPQTAEEFSTGIEGGERYRIRSVGPVQELGAGERIESTARLYVGPKLQDRLEAIAPGLKLTLDYGIFTTLAAPMAVVLGWLHDLTSNWGWAIVLLVVLLKALLFKLSESQYKSFAKMRAVQPRIEALKERYGDDRQKFQTAMMELYKKEKINPMGGCLPILIQIPIFISLYWVLIESVELRHAPWILWIENLTAPDPYFILPALNLVIMWATQLLSPTPGMDPVQKRMMQIMPIAFGVMFAFFPAGLVLYWTTNGALGLLQQWVITRRHGPKPAAAAS